MVQTRAQRQASGGSSEGLANQISSPTITKPDLAFRAESLSPVMKLSPSQGLAALSAGLARRLADEHANSNLVFSPLSIYAALALVAAGARGATLDEILRVLGTQSRQEVDEFVARAAGDALRDQSGSGGPRVAFACGVWSDQSCPLKPGFREAVVAGAYGAEASTVNFHGDPKGVCRLINAWATRATNGLINSVLVQSSVTRATRVVLGNAVYFKGNWEQPFEKRSTQKGPFRRLHGAGPVDVPFMQSWKKQSIAVHDGFKVLKLEYKMAEARRTSQSSHRHGNQKRSTPYSRSSGSQNRRGSVAHNTTSSASDSFVTRTRFSMCIFLPDADDGLPSLLDAIASRPGFLHEHLPRGEQVRVGEFMVPRFKLSFHSSVVGALDKLGLRLPFHEAADLSDMMDSGFPMFVSDVIHKAVIEVSEEGTKAAAVTMDMIKSPMKGRMQAPPVDFVADHPFAYFIVEEETEAVVFAGHVLDPSRK